MARFIIENITIEQAEELANWYSCQGEQQAETWFECQDGDMEAPSYDKMGSTEDSVTVYAK